MPATKQDRADIAANALRKTLIAVEWLSDARESALEPNGDAAYARRTQHARQKLLEALALIDGRPAALDSRPSALAPVQLPPRAPAVAGR